MKANKMHYSNGFTKCKKWKEMRMLSVNIRQLQNSDKISKYLKKMEGAIN